MDLLVPLCEEGVQWQERSVPLVTLGLLRIFGKVREVGAPAEGYRPDPHRQPGLHSQDGNPLTKAGVHTWEE